MPLRNVSRVASALLAWAVISSIAAPAAAQTALNVQRASANTFRVDGALRDWAAVAMQPFGAGDDASFEVALAQDDAGVYVAARVRDERMIRTRRPGDSRMAKATKNSRICVGQRLYHGACASARRSNPREK